VADAPRRHERAGERVGDLAGDEERDVEAEATLIFLEGAEQVVQR